VLEVGEHDGGFGDIADAVGAGGDVLQDAPAAHRQGEAAFAERPHRAAERVGGAVVPAEAAPIGGLLERDMDPDTGAVAVVAGVGGRQGLGRTTSYRGFTHMSCTATSSARRRQRRTASHAT
jgi:hypothetical protein